LIYMFVYLYICADPAVMDVFDPQGAPADDIYIYIYIYRERERERRLIDLYVCIHRYVCGVIDVFDPQGASSPRHLRVNPPSVYFLTFLLTYPHSDLPVS